MLKNSLRGLTARLTTSKLLTKGLLDIAALGCAVAAVFVAFGTAPALGAAAISLAVLDYLVTNG